MVELRRPESTGPYEQLRDSAPRDIAAAWRQADRLENELRAFYSWLEEDNRYTSEYKSQEAWSRCERDAPRIRDGREKVKRLLTERIDGWRRQSIPTPEGHGLITTDDTKFLLSQNELTRITRKIDRLVASATGPVRPDRVRLLKSEPTSKSLREKAKAV
jgi:hypothetical protein